MKHAPSHELASSHEYKPIRLGPPAFMFVSHGKKASTHVAASKEESHDIVPPLTPPSLLHSKSPMSSQLPRPSEQELQVYEYGGGDGGLVWSRSQLARVSQLQVALAHPELQASVFGSSHESVSRISPSQNQGPPVAFWSHPLAALHVQRGSATTVKPISLR